jgi:hypothetical protein
MHRGWTALAGQHGFGIPSPLNHFVNVIDREWDCETISGLSAHARIVEHLKSPPSPQGFLSHV